MDRGQQYDRDTQPENPSARGKHRHVHMVEHEHLISQHGEPIEIIGPFVMGNGRDRRLQSGDVRFECYRHLVAKAPLHPGADRSQDPRGRCR